MGPSMKHAPLREYENETWADWLRRQNDPKGTTRAANKKDPIIAAPTAPGSSIATPTKE